MNITDFTPGDQNIRLTLVTANGVGTEKIDEGRFPSVAVCDQANFYEKR